MADDPNKITYFALTNSRGKEVPFGIKRKDRARHMYVIGKTGVGKSTMLENLAIQDIRNGEGLAFIDPHGSTADKLLDYVPEHRLKDVIYFAPFDMEYPVAFNVMEDVGYDKRHLVVSGLLSAFRKIWVDAWSARMEYILSNVLLALLEYPNSTLLDVNTMLVNKGFRKRVVDNIKDPLVKKFWEEEFAGYTDRYTQEATPAIQNKIGQFTNNPLIRNIVGQPQSSFDIRQVMDEKKILIINLSKGRVGEVNATLLGSMLVTKIYLAAMSRADVHAQELDTLPPFYFYVDEFQSFANKSFADILSEARKYKLNLIIAHQFIEQMEEEVRNAVFGNVGTTVAFRVGPFDAEVLETLFKPQFEATDLVNLGMGQIYLTLMIDGIGSQPFSAQTLMPFDPPPQKHTDKILAESRRVYAKPRAEVEKAIEEWQAVESPPMPAADKKPRAKTTLYGSPSPAPKLAPGVVSSVGAPYQRAAQTPPPALRAAAPAPEPAPAVPATPRVEPAAPAPTPVVTPAPAPAPQQQASLAAHTPRPAPPAPHKPRVQQPPHRAPEHRAGKERDAQRPTPPALEGATSLRDALARVAAVPPSAPANQTQSHQKTDRPAPHHGPRTDARNDLKSALSHLAGVAPSTPTPTPTPTHAATTPHKSAHEQKSENTKPAPGVPNDTLRAMLDVGDIHGQ